MISKIATRRRGLLAVHETEQESLIISLSTELRVQVMDKQDQLPIEGVRVVDFGKQIAGPAVAMVLADLGATVVHIDPPSGPQWKHQANAILNRNKSCLSVDLKTPEGFDQAMQLIDCADVVI